MRQLRDAGWTVKALKRGQAAAHEVSEGIHWLRGDALNALDVAGAAHVRHPLRWLSVLVLAVLAADRKSVV